jgi:hypothetical protein
MLSNKGNAQKPKLVVVSSNGVVDQTVARPPVAASVAAKHLAYSQVIKTGDLKKDSVSTVKIDSFIPSQIAIQRPVVSAPGSAQESQARSAVAGLKANLKTLNDLQARLRFMLTELEDLVEKA